MTRIVSHIAVAAAALAVGGLGATAFSNSEPARSGAAVPTQPAAPEEVRTVVVTKTIHRVRHVRVHRPTPAAAPPVAVAPRPAPAPVAARQTVALRPTHPISTHTSGHAAPTHKITTHTSGGGGGEHEHEGGGDD